MAAHQVPPSLGFSRQEHWSGLPFPSPGDLPGPGIKPRSPSLQADSLPAEPPGKPSYMFLHIYIYTHTYIYKCHNGDFGKQKFYNKLSINKIKMFFSWLIFGHCPRTCSDSVTCECWHDVFVNQLPFVRKTQNQDVPTQTSFSHRTNDFTLTWR